MAEWLFVFLICVSPSTFHLQEDNFPAFSGPDWYHFSSNDSFYFPRNECREISKKYKNGYCLKKPTTPTRRCRDKYASPGTFDCGHRRLGTLVLSPFLCFLPGVSPCTLFIWLPFPHSAPIDPSICLPAKLFGPPSLPVLFNILFSTLSPECRTRVSWS